MTPPPKKDRSGKREAARAAAALVGDGMNVGLGSGTTAALVVRALGERVANEGLRFIGVPTSVETAVLAKSLKITLRELDDVEALDLSIDGADEIDPGFRMLKGRGGALLREKIVASSALRRVTVLTPEKRVAHLGVSAPVPVEVSPVGVRHLARRLRDLGADPVIRQRADGSPYMTDGGNMIIDLRFSELLDPDAVDARLQQVVGVFETGLFIGLCDLLIVGYDDRIEHLEGGKHRH